MLASFDAYARFRGAPVNDDGESYLRGRHSIWHAIKALLLLSSKPFFLPMRSSEASSCRRRRYSRRFTRACRGDALPRLQLTHSHDVNITPL